MAGCGNARGARRHVLIVTKACHYSGDEDRVRKDALDADIATSMTALGVDSIDLLLLHRDDPTVPVGEVVDWLAEHQARGHIAAYGGSNWAPERVDAANAYATRKSLAPFAAVSNNLSLAVAREPMWRGCVYADATTRAWHSTTQMPNLAWSSQAHGFFGGRFRPGQIDDANVRRVYDSPTNWERLGRATELAERLGVTPIQIACAYVLCQPFPSFALIGPANGAELQESLAAADIRLTTEQRRWLEGTT